MIKALLPTLDEVTAPPFRQLVLKPTVYCYHRCPYCDLRQNYYADLIDEVKRSVSRPSHPGHMPFELALRLIDEGAAMGMNELLLSGGDPLIYPNLLDLIAAGARHSGVFVFMNSVGTGATVDRARQLMDAGLGAWNFSIDTLHAEQYELLRGVPGALRRILKAVDHVQEAAREFPRFRVNFMTVISRHNFRHLPDLVFHCASSGVASVHLMNVYGDMDRQEFLLSVEQIREFRDEIVPATLAALMRAQVQQTVLDNARVVLGSFFSKENPDTNYAKGTYWPDLESVRTACNIPNYYALVEADGRVLPCCLVEIEHRGEVGSVKDTGLSNVWASRTFAEFRQDRVSFCQNCSVPRNRTLGLTPEMCRQFGG